MPPDVIWMIFEYLIPQGPIMHPALGLGPVSMQDYSVALVLLCVNRTISAHVRAMLFESKQRPLSLALSDRSITFRRTTYHWPFADSYVGRHGMKVLPDIFSLGLHHFKYVNIEIMAFVSDDLHRTLATLRHVLSAMKT